MAPVNPKRTDCQWCSAINCKNSRNKRQDLGFFRFPKDPERCRRWVINCRRADLDGKPALSLFKGNVLCQDHFEPSLVRKTEHRTRLVTNAVPTLFHIPNPPKPLQSSRPPAKDRSFCVAGNETESKFEEVDMIVDGEDDTIEGLKAQLEREIASNLELKVEISILKKKLKSEKCKLWRLVKKTSKKTSYARVPSKATKQICIENNKLKDIESQLRGYFSGPGLQFIMTQLRVSNKHINRRRWTNADKSMALSIYHASRKAYKLLQKVFNLPSMSTLTRAMQNLYIKPGVPINLLNLFKVKVQAMGAVEKKCVVVCDEMALKAAVKYNPQDDEVEGFEDFGHLGRTDAVATHTLVFMIRGLTRNWKQPFSYVLSSGPVKAHMLQQLLLHVIEKLMEIGLDPKVVVCDQGSNNRSMFTRLGVTEDAPYFKCCERKIYAMYDPPHLLKSIRNNLKLHGYTVDGKPVSWDQVVKFYETDNKMPIRMAPKLTSRHITMPPFSHLRVSLAAQVLSHSVAAGITTMVNLNALPQEAMHTANFIEQFDQLFNAFNSRILKGKNRMSHAITSTSRHMEFLRNTLDWMKRVRCNNATGNLPCLNGWKQTISCLMQLWADLSTDGVDFLLTSRLNQDCLENLFSTIRGKGGHRFNPEPSEFRTSLRQTMVDLLMVTSDRQNCKDDLDSFLFNLETIRSQSNAVERSRLEDDVPKSLHGIMLSPIAPPLTTLEQNITTYIAGYITRRLRPLLCPSCVQLISGDKDSITVTQIFLHSKNYAAYTDGGLVAPSALLATSCETLESTFRAVVPTAIKTSGIRKTIVSHMVAKDLQLTCTSDQKCDIKNYVVSLFTNIRLHHQLRCQNRELSTAKSKTASSSSSSSRKTSTFKHL